MVLARFRDDTFFVQLKENTNVYVRLRYSF